MPFTYARNRFVKYICQAALVHFVLSLRPFKIFFKVKFIHIFVILLPMWLRGLSLTSRVYTHSIEAAFILFRPHCAHLTDMCVCNSQTRCFVVKK